MLHRHTLGRIPPKPHIAFRDEDGRLLMEQCVTREGFNGPFTILYFRTPPTDEFAAERFAVEGFCPAETIADQPLHRRHVRSQDLKPGGDFLTGRRTLFVNDDLHIGQCKPTESAERFFSNGDGDELYFVTSGSGWLESVYGRLAFREHDYLLIPKSTPYRLHFEGRRGKLGFLADLMYVSLGDTVVLGLGNPVELPPMSTVDSEVDRGTTFTIKIPLAPETTENQTQTKPKEDKRVRVGSPC